MVLTRVWYPCNVLMLTLFWMTRAVIGIRGRTSMCRMNSFWPLSEKTMHILDLSCSSVWSTWGWLDWSCTSRPSTSCSTSPEEQPVKPLSLWPICQGALLWEKQIGSLVEQKTYRIGAAPHSFFGFAINASRLVEIFMIDYFDFFYALVNCDEAKLFGTIWSQMRRNYLVCEFQICAYWMEIWFSSRWVYFDGWLVEWLDGRMVC